MRDRELIEKDGKRVDLLQLEVLLDIRDLLVHGKGTIVPIVGTKKKGRPPKTK